MRTLLLAVSSAELTMAAFNAFNMYGYGDVVTALGLSPECTHALYGNSSCRRLKVLEIANVYRNSTIECDANGAGRAALRDLNDCE